MDYQNILVDAFPELANEPVAINPFVWDDSEYKRDFNNYEHYIEYAGLYLSVVYDEPYEQCVEWVREVTAPEGRFARVIPRILTLTRPSEGNRILETVTPDEFFGDIVTNHRIVSPSLAVYFHPKQKKSILSLFIVENVRARSKAKKEMFLAKQQGNKQLENIKNDEQVTKKTANNSLSGAHNSLFTILFMRSAHSSLTSTCRTATAYANANNEKFLAGNRHYYSPEVTMEALVSTLHLVDLPRLAEVVEKYQLHQPTPEEVLETIRYSSDYYWPHASEQHSRFLEFARRLSPIQRCAIVYVQDAWHLKKYNESVMREFISKLITVCDFEHPNPKAVWKLMSDDIKAFVFSLHGPELMGKPIIKLPETDPDLYGKVAATTVKTWKVLSDYSDLIETLWATPIVPASVAHFTSSIRRASLLSDTDSTIFTVQDWCSWYSNVEAVNRETSAVRNVMIFFAGQQISHILAIVSANMGVATEQLHQLAMKNEYSFPALALTTRAKHYFASINEQEGTVFAKRKIEQKGVEMKNSKTSKELRDGAEEMVEWILDTVVKGEKLEILPRLKQIGDMEREIIESVKTGKIKYLTTTQIKNSESYSQGEESANYQHHVRWEAVFASKYGPAPTLPYDCVKVSLCLDSSNKVEEWLTGLEDKQFAETIRTYWIKTGKKPMSTMILPREICLRNGVPAEITKAIDVRKLVYTAMSTFYLELESLGFYFVNKDLTRLVSDYY